MKLYYCNKPLFQMISAKNNACALYGFHALFANSGPLKSSLKCREWRKAAGIVPSMDKVMATIF